MSSVEVFNGLNSKILRFIRVNDTNANVNLLEEEHGIAPGQACVFYAKNNNGYKVLGGGWIKS